jgi:hypothetical protein
MPGIPRLAPATVSVSPSWAFEPVAEALDLYALLAPELGIQVAQGLVEPESDRVPDHRSADRNPLALAAAQLRGPATQQVLETERLRRRPYPGVLLGLRQLCCVETEPDVLSHREVGIDGVVLEHHGDIALLGCELVHHLAVDGHDPAADILEP